MTGDIKEKHHNFSDSQAAFKAPSYSTIGSTMVWEWLQKLNELCKRDKVPLLWVPGYIEIERNENANNLARIGSSTASVGSEPFCALGGNYFKISFKRGEEANRSKLWRGVKGLRQAKDVHRNYYLKLAIGQ